MISSNLMTPRCVCAPSVALQLELTPASQPPSYFHNLREPGRPQFVLNSIPMQSSGVIVRRALELTTPQHAVVHEPTYLPKHDAWIDRLQRGDFVLRHRLLAVYFALVSVGMYFMDESEVFALGFTAGEWRCLLNARTTLTAESAEEKELLPTKWFHLAVDCLYTCDFLTVPSLETVRAICILTLVAHNLNASSLISSLLHIGVKIAQSLQLHNIPPEREEAGEGRVNREIGRRIWACLYVGDVLTPVGNPSDILLLDMGRTGPPSNVDNDDLADDKPMLVQPMHETTSAT